MELFPDQPVYEYPQLINLLYSFSWSFVLSGMIAITHKLTFTGDHYPRNFFQSLVLGAIVTTLVMMAIGDSLARGLGVFGAMAIIRFRTRIEDPRDVLFLFAALSTGLAIGVYGISISFVGSLLFCVVAFALHFSPFRSYGQYIILNVTLVENATLDELISLLHTYCLDYRVLSVNASKTDAKRYRYGVNLKRDITMPEFIDKVSSLSSVASARIGVNEINLPQ